MICPKCHHRKTAVIDTRPRASTAARRRRCARCNHLFNTSEYTEEQLAAYIVAQRNDTLESVRIDLAKLAADANALVRQLALRPTRK